ncbi:type II toxin-antitoxin system VapC family toxin [Flagellatimonas centrodinii]|uniref:type II toxin-antitoxin system VapC family toxin n=1 Tax=Flagellatimonas centrodinii TaxID=2806210 RepID=UPI001FED6063|nr:type II toxin-antitoxin system VapC family toxin [Flagellatimonas centrodinii]ULQ47532.1 type II toxin-antitoxin system VapC family toxin [Flagellatimonas centrodinii]
MTLGEIERGIVQQRSSDPAFAEQLADWFDRVTSLYQDRILPIDAQTARCWGTLVANLGHSSTDLMIAATAMTHGLQVATRNVRHFTPTGVGVVNPFDSKGVLSQSRR